jgi:OOP family OmpA-OmpF porin
MSPLVLELAQNYFLGSTARQTSLALDESEPSVRAGLQRLVPLVLGGLLVHTRRPGGAAEVATLAQQLYGRGLLSDLSELLAGLQRSPTADSARAADMLLGHDHAATLASLSEQAGLRPESAHQLLHVVGAVVLSLLGREAAQQHLGATGLASYLESQREAIRHAVSSLPSEVGSSLADLLRDVPHTTAKIVASAHDSPAHPSVLPLPPPVLPTAPSSASPEPVPPSSTKGTISAGQLGQDPPARSSRPDLLPDTAATDHRPATGGAPVGSHPTGAPVRPLGGPARAAARPRWPWLLALLSLALLGYFGGKYFQQRGLGQPASGGTVAPARVALRGSTFATGYYEGATDRYYYDLGPTVRLPLPTGQTLQVGANSTEAQLFYLLTDNANARPDPAQAGICLDRVSFEAGTATLTAASQAQVTNLVALFQAYPNAQFKVGGFTDNQGRAEASLLLSADRANAVRQALLQQALAPNRVTAQGYGQTHPLASNATPAGRAQNRRVAILLLKK